MRSVAAVDEVTAGMRSTYRAGDEHGDEGSFCDTDSTASENEGHKDSEVLYSPQRSERS